MYISFLRRSVFTQCVHETREHYDIDIIMMSSWDSLYIELSAIQGYDATNCVDFGDKIVPGCGSGFKLRLSGKASVYLNVVVRQVHRNELGHFRYLYPSNGLNILPLVSCEVIGVSASLNGAFEIAGGRPFEKEKLVLLSCRGLMSYLHR